MEGKKSNNSISEISQMRKEENKLEHFNNTNDRMFFNSITGEKMTIEDGNEDDMYEIVPDMEQYAQDNINQYIDICEKDKEFFMLWNSFIKSKENSYFKLDALLMEFLNINSKKIYINDLGRNFVQHLVAIYDNRQIDDDNLKKIIDKMHNLFKQYEK